MPQYLALTYTADVDWWAPEQADELAEYRQFGVDHADTDQGERRPAPDLRRRPSSGSRAPAAGRSSRPTGRTRRPRKR